MRLTIAPEISTRAPLLSLGVLTMRGLTVRAKDDALWRELETASVGFAARGGLNEIASDPRVTAVRRLFKAVGVDPSRYRPSSEALVRRVAQGKGLYQINTAVDVNNWCSLEERLPFGIYDAQQVGAEVLLRLGRENEVYEGIGKSLVALEGKMVLCDERGPFGSPISDSTRAMVTTDTRDIQLVVFAADVARADLADMVRRTGERMMKYNAGALDQIECVMRDA